MNFVASCSDLTAFVPISCSSKIPAAATTINTMSSWNVDAYRSVSLSECHWKLCREFMTRYRHLYPEEQTVALAQIFANAQLLLRGDADQTTRLVLDLAKEQPSTEVKLEVDGIEKQLVKREVVSDDVVVKTEQIEESERDDNAE